MITEIDSLDKLITYLDSKIGKKEDQIDRHHVMAFFDNRLTGQTVLETMLKWFYNPKGLQKSDMGSASLWRKRWYDHMNANSFTWIDSNNSSLHLEKFAAEWNLTTDDVKKLLFHDHTINFRIKQIGDKTNRQEVMQRYNTEIIKYLFSKTNKMSFSISNQQITGPLVKTLIRNAKYWGVYVELVEKDNSIFFDATGPVQLVGKPTKYGKLLYALFYSILPHLKDKLNIFLDVSYNDRSMKVCLPLFEFPSLIPLDNTFSQNINSSFDSKIELKFFKEFSRTMPHWDIQSEEVLVKKSRIFIPDFVLTYRNTSVYLEIVGFWTETYLKKKIEKITWFSKHYDNIILLVDDKLEFPDNIVPTFKYGKRLSMNKLTEFVIQNFEEKEFDDYMDNLLNNKETLIHDIDILLEKTPILKEKAIIKLLGTRSASKTKDVLIKLFGEMEESNFIVLNWINLIIKKTYIDNIETVLKDLVPRDGISEEKLFYLLKIDQATFDAIISYFGYSKQYNSLIDVKIYPS